MYHIVILYHISLYLIVYCKFLAIMVALMKLNLRDILVHPCLWHTCGLSPGVFVFM